mgnify:CR=1 FL=1
MLFPVNNEDLDLKKNIIATCGKEYSVFKRILKRNYGSYRYQLINIHPKHNSINLENYDDIIYLNFDLRDGGIVFYFRYKNTEYVEFCQFHKISFQSNDSSFVLQTDQFMYSFKILKNKEHKEFILKLYEFKNKI